MDIISYAINRVRRTIPAKILQLAFMEESKAYELRTSLDKQIESIVIDQQVLVDCNLINGITTRVSLNRCLRDTFVGEDGIETSIVTIPPVLLGNKKILAVIDIEQSSGIQDNRVTNSRNNFVDMASKMLGPSDSNFTLTTNIRLLSNNVLLINEPMNIFMNGIINLELENEAHLENIPRRSYIEFAQMVVYAVQAFIYNELSIPLENSGLYFGHDISGISNVISKYEGSQELYDTFLTETWPKISFASDPIKMDEFISDKMGRPLM